MMTEEKTAPSKPRGRPPKKKPLEARKKIKHIFRAISPTGVYNEALGVAPVAEIEAYIELFLNDGYELKLTQHLSRVKAPDTTTVIGEQMLYVLVKNA